jgi:hypothetical protein
MAQRRMFSKTITNSSQFLMMPQSSQNLYFHLGMNADDDGFCEHFTIMRMTESKPDDLKILQAKNFINVFDDKVLVIIDWKENNYLRADRYTPSKYLEIYKNELVGLSIGIPKVDKVATQDRIGKVRLGKDRIKKNIITSDEVNQIIEFYNYIFQTKYRATPDRSKKIKLRLKTYTLDEIKTSIKNMKASKFHNGDNDRGWKATIDFIIRNDEKIDEFLNISEVKPEDITINKKPYFMGKQMTNDLRFVIFGKNDLREFAGNKKDIIYK